MTSRRHCWRTSRSVSLHTGVHADSIRGLLRGGRALQPQVDQVQAPPRARSSRGTTTLATHMTPRAQSFDVDGKVGEDADWRQALAAPAARTVLVSARGLVPQHRECPHPTAVLRHAVLARVGLGWARKHALEKDIDPSSEIDFLWCPTPGTLMHISVPRNADPEMDLFTRALNILGLCIAAEIACVMFVSTRGRRDSSAAALTPSAGRADAQPFEPVRVPHGVSGRVLQQYATWRPRARAQRDAQVWHTAHRRRHCLRVRDPAPVDDVSHAHSFEVVSCRGQPRCVAVLRRACARRPRGAHRDGRARVRARTTAAGRRRSPRATHRADCTTSSTRCTWPAAHGRCPCLCAACRRSTGTPQALLRRAPP